MKTRKLTKGMARIGYWLPKNSSDAFVVLRATKSDSDMWVNQEIGWLLTESQYSAVVERMARAMWITDWPNAIGPKARILAPYHIMSRIYHEKAVRALKAIGITAPKAAIRDGVHRKSP